LDDSLPTVDLPSSLSAGSHQYVCINPFPLISTLSGRSVNQCLHQIEADGQMSANNFCKANIPSSEATRKEVYFSNLPVAGRLNQSRGGLTNVNLVRFTVAFHSCGGVHRLYHFC
jgi:hypothetical protein